MYLEVFCQIVEYLQSAPVLNLFIEEEHLDSLENERVLTSGKIIWKKKQSLVRITFSCKTGKSLSTI